MNLDTCDSCQRLVQQCSDLNGRAEVVKAALQQGHTVTRCACNGPRVHSVRTTATLCLRCGLAEEAEAIELRAKSWRRCGICRGSMAGQNKQAKYCPSCQRLDPKRRRWKREAAQTAADRKKSIENSQ
jgi:hypothetical protein